MHMLRWQTAWRRLVLAVCQGWASLWPHSLLAQRACGTALEPDVDARRMVAVLQQSTGWAGGTRAATEGGGWSSWGGGKQGERGA